MVGQMSRCFKSSICQEADGVRSNLQYIRSDYPNCHLDRSEAKWRDLPTSQTSQTVATN